MEQEQNILEISITQVSQLLFFLRKEEPANGQFAEGERERETEPNSSTFILGRSNLIFKNAFLDIYIYIYKSVIN